MKLVRSLSSQKILWWLKFSVSAPMYIRTSTIILIDGRKLRFFFIKSSSVSSFPLHFYVRCHIMYMSKMYGGRKKKKKTAVTAINKQTLNDEKAEKRERGRERKIANGLLFYSVICVLFHIYL